MSIDRDDWLYLGGAAAGGVVIGAIVSRLFAPAVKPPGRLIHTGLVRVYAPPAHDGPSLTAMIWAIPEGGYTITVQNPGGEPAFPDMKMEAFTAPFTAAMAADSILEDLGYKPESAWASVVNEASETRRKERTPAIASSRRPR